MNFQLYYNKKDDEDKKYIISNPLKISEKKSSLLRVANDEAFVPLIFKSALVYSG